jgi:predicted nucleic acid-binding protein
MIIDASALAAYILREEGYDAIKNYIEDGVTSVELIAKEVSNAILIARKRRIIDTKQAEKAFEALKMLLKRNIKTSDQEAVLNTAFKIALKHEVMVYDALYIALTKEKEAELLTRDIKQIRVAEKNE